MSDGERLLRVVKTIRETAGEPSSGLRPAVALDTTAAEQLLAATVGFLVGVDDLLRAIRTAETARGLDDALLDAATGLAERSRNLGRTMQQTAAARLEAAGIDVHPLLETAHRSSAP